MRRTIVTLNGPTFTTYPPFFQTRGFHLFPPKGAPDSKKMHPPVQVLPPKFRTNKMHTHPARRIDQHKPVKNKNAFTVVQDRATLESDPSGSTGFAKQMRIVK